MGFFGMQCMLSGLPEGKDVRTGVVFLYSYKDYQADNGAPQYTFDDEYCVLLPPLWGQYDGYGKVVVDDENGILCSWAKAYLRSIGAKFSGLTNLQDVIREEVVEVQTNPKGMLFYALVRKDVWNEMVAASTESVLKGYYLPKVKSEKALRKTFDQAMNSVLKKTRLKSGSLAHRIHRIILSGRKAPEAYFFNLKGTEVPEEIMQSAFETFMVIMGMEQLGIMVHPGITGAQMSNLRARKAFIKRILKLCDKDIENGLED